jgi:hypothetical protein
MTSIARPDYSHKPDQAEAKGAVAEPVATVSSVRSLKIKSRTRTVSIRTGKYDVRAKVFQTESPFNESEAYLVDEDGVFVAVDAGLVSVDTYVFFPSSVLQSMIQGCQTLKKKQALKFAEEHYEVFAQIVADLNSSRDYSWSKGTSLPFLDDENCFVTNDAQRVRVYLYDRF